MEPFSEAPAINTYFYIGMLFTDNLGATANEVINYSKENEFRIQKIREQFATYQVCTKLSSQVQIVLCKNMRKAVMQRKLKKTLLKLSHRFAL